MKFSRKQLGMTLIEVLVSILIFAFGVLGMVAMQARASRMSVDAEDRNRAAILANDIVGSMWSAQTNDVTNSHLSATYATWQTNVANSTDLGLPNGVGSVSAPDANNMVTITITWSSPQHQGSGQYVTKVSFS